MGSGPVGVVAFLSSPVAETPSKDAGVSAYFLLLSFSVQVVESLLASTFMVLLMLFPSKLLLD